MLKILRRRLKLILWILLAAFILWGIGTALATRYSPSLQAGTLYGRPVTVQAFQAALDSRRRRAILTYGERALSTVPPAELERQAWDWLLLTTAAQRARIRATDREVVEELRQWPLFQRDGRFDSKTYEFVVRYSLGTTPRLFEEEIRAQLAVAKLIDRVAGAGQVTDDELRAAYREEAEAVQVAYVVMEPAGLIAHTVVSDADVRAHYNAHAAEFQSEPKVQIRYLCVTPEAVSARVPVSDADVIEEYLRHAARDQQGTPPPPERQRALRRQLLTTRAREEAARVAETLREQWTATPDLGALGQPYGLTPRETPPVASGETLTEIPSSQEVIAAALTLTPGTISRAVETPEGHYLLTLAKMLPAQPITLEQAAPRIRTLLQDQQARRLAAGAARNALATAQELAAAGAPDPLGPAAEPLGLRVQRTDFVTRASPVGDTTAGTLLGPAFGLADGQVGGPWPTAHGWVIAQRLARRPPDDAQFAQAKARLRPPLLQRKRTQLVEHWLLQLRAEAKPTPTSIPSRK